MVPSLLAKSYAYDNNLYKFLKNCAPRSSVARFIEPPVSTPLEVGKVY